MTSEQIWKFAGGLIAVICGIFAIIAGGVIKDKKLIKILEQEKLKGYIFFNSGIR